MPIAVAIPVAAAVAAAAAIAGGEHLGPPTGDGQPAPSHPNQIVELLAQPGDVRVDQVDAPIDVLLGLVRRPVRRTRKHQLVFGFDLVHQLRLVALAAVHFGEHIRHLPSHHVQPASHAVLLTAVSAGAPLLGAVAPAGHPISAIDDIWAGGYYIYYCYIPPSRGGWHRTQGRKV